MRVRNSAVLARKLLTSPNLLHCFFFSSFAKPTKYPAALWTGANAPALINCRTDLQGALDDAFIDR